jgi:Autotransporter beta-domain
MIYFSGLEPSTLARTTWLGAALLSAAVLSASAQAAPVCNPSPYVSGDLSCTNSGTFTAPPGNDGMDTNATGGNATAANSGTLNASGNGIIGMSTSSDTGNATASNSGTINVTGSFLTGMFTQTNNGVATTNNSGIVNVAGSSSGFNVGISTFSNTNATTNNVSTGTINVSGGQNNRGIDTEAGFGFTTQFGTEAATAPPAGPVTATSNNDGTVNVTGNSSTGIATTIGVVSTTGTATTNNGGHVNVTGVNSVGIGTNSEVAGTRPQTLFAGLPVVGNAITNNTGTVNVDGTVNTSPAPPGPPEPPGPPRVSTICGIGCGGGTIGISTTASGNAITYNSGAVNVTAYTATGIFTQSQSGNAVTVNNGVVNVVGTTTFVSGGGGAIGFGIAPPGFSVGIVNTAFNGGSVVYNAGVVSVTGPNNVGVYISSNSTSVLINSGVISAPGGVAVQFAPVLTDPAVLTLLPGSFMVGAINLIGSGDFVNVFAGNQNLTFNSLTGVNVSGNVPFVVVGNRLVSVDPTGFAATDRSLMDFTRAISATLGGRVNEAWSNGSAGGMRALGFAGYDDSTSRLEDAFSQVMGYAKSPDSAMVFKNPTVSSPDGTTVWAKGFYGQHVQQAEGPFGPVLHNVTNFYGGALGADRLIQPDLRLGGFVGGGETRTTIDFNMGKVNTDIGFGGVYGRKDIGAAFVDFALLGGHTDNHTTRNINNNLLANGLEIATAGFGGWFVSPEVAAGYRYAIGPNWTVTPTGHLRYLAASYDGFTETGSTANLTVGNRSLQNLEERIDITLTRSWLSDIGRLQLGLTGGGLGQQRTGGDNVNAILLGQALAFATPGKSSITGGYVGGSVDWRMRNGFAVFGATEYTKYSDSSSTVTGKAGVRYGW